MYDLEDVGCGEGLATLIAGIGALSCVRACMLVHVATRLEALATCGTYKGAQTIVHVLMRLETVCGSELTPARLLLANKWLTRCLPLLFLLLLELLGLLIGEGESIARSGGTLAPHDNFQLILIVWYDCYLLCSNQMFRVLLNKVLDVPGRRAEVDEGRGFHPQD